MSCILKVVCMGMKVDQLIYLQGVQGRKSTGYGYKYKCYLWNLISAFVLTRRMFCRIHPPSSLNLTSSLLLLCSCQRAVLKYLLHVSPCVSVCICALVNPADGNPVCHCRPRGLMMYADCQLSWDYIYISTLRIHMWRRMAQRKNDVNINDNKVELHKQYGGNINSLEQRTRSVFHSALRGSSA